MKRKLAKTLASFTMAAVFAFTGVAAQAAEITAAESPDALSIESCAANIKSIYKEKYPEQTDVVDGVVDIITADETFIEIFEVEGAAAFQMVEDSLHDALDPYVEPLAFDEDMYWVDHLIPSIQQAEENFCGPASLVMALIGAQKINYTSDTSITDKLQYDYAKETGIVSASGVNSGKGVEIEEMKNFLQKRFPVNSMGDTYRNKIFTKYSIKPIESFLRFALLCDTLPIIWVDEPQRLNYYPDNYNLGRHYIVVNSIDLSTGEVGVRDPHWDDKYFGRHDITLAEIEDLVNSKGNLWMCVYTRTSENPEDHG